MKRVAIIISPNWRDYGKKYLADCLESVRKQDYPGESKIFLIDNETTDESYAFLKKVLSEVYPVGDDPLSGAEIIRNKNNDGFAKGNNDAMRAALAQGFDYLILFNMDTVVDGRAVAEMVKAAESDPSAGSGQVGAVQARLMLHPETDKINSLGNATHFLGFGYAVGYKQKMSNVPPRGDSPRVEAGKCPARLASRLEAGGQMSRPTRFATRSGRANVKDIFYPSGAAVLFKAEALREVGLFDEEYWMYNEDQELGWRIWLAGWRVVLAPEAVVYHKYEFSRSTRKYYWMDRNRILSILKCYHPATLLLILPAFILYEIGLFAFAAKGGWLKEKLKVYGYFLKFENWQKIIASRQKVQKSRKIKDREIARLISGRILFQEFDSWPMRVANFIFNFYWQIIKRIIFW